VVQPARFAGERSYAQVKTMPASEPITNAAAPASQQRLQSVAMRWSLALGIAMLVGKSVAYWLTGSAAILSDAIESVIHIAAVGFAAFSVALSQRPARESSPYGYERISFLSAGFEGGMISIAAIWIIAVAVQKWLTGLRIERLGTGALLTLAAAAINLGLGLYLVRTGRRTKSIIVEANGQHVLTDSWTSFGVVGGLVLVLLTGWKLLDPLVAIAVAFNILLTAGQLMRRSVIGLLDLPDPAVAGRIRETCEAVCKELGIGHHRLRFRDAGQHIIVSVHLLFPHHLPLGRAHQLATHFERLFADRMKIPMEVVTHLESVEDHGNIHPAELPNWDR
jgi:cation diffusion facilitator family transporter